MAGVMPPHSADNEESGSNGASSGANNGTNKFDGFDKIKHPNMSALLCSRPNNVVSGIVAGLGNTTGAVLVAVGKRCHMLILLNYANTSYPPAVFAEYFRKIPGTCTKTCTLQNKL